MCNRATVALSCLFDRNSDLTLEAAVEAVNADADNKLLTSYTCTCTYNCMHCTVWSSGYPVVHMSANHLLAMQDLFNYLYYANTSLFDRNFHSIEMEGGEIMLIKEVGI